MKDFINGHRFRDFCKSNVGILFSETHNLKETMSIVRHNTDVKYTIVSHNSDGRILPYQREPYDYYLEDIPKNVEKWYAQNCDVKDPRLVPIPIGLENVEWFPKIKKNHVLEKFINMKLPRKKLLYINHNIQTNANIRKVPYKIFKNLSWATVEHGRNGTEFEHYVRQIKSHKFVLCPDGNGSDTHRTWEALYLGAIPIVQPHVFTEVFAKYFPMLVVRNYEEIIEDSLEIQYEEIANMNHDKKYLTMEFWEKLILNKKGL